jgi:hypothetical protein
MAKFAMIVSKLNDSKSVKAFQKKYSEKNLKKNFKCNDVILLDRNGKSCGDFDFDLKIKENTFEKLSWLLTFADKDSLIDHEYVNYSTRKFFIFSDDALQSMFSFDCLSDDVYISAFELNQDSANDLVQKLDDISGIQYRVERLNEAQDVYSTLEDIANECDLNIFYRTAEDDIDEALSDAESELEQLKSDIKEIINSSWS